MDAGEGDIVFGGESKGSARGSVHGRSDDATAIDIEGDPERCRFGRSQSDFILQSLMI